MRRIVRWTLRLLAAATAPLALYLLAALAFGVIAVSDPPGAPEPDDVTIHIADNGAHLDLVLPLRTPEVDWREILRPEHFPLLRFDDVAYIGFGWGDRGFYLNTPRWADLQAGTAWRALTGQGGVVVRALAFGGVPSGANVKPVRLSAGAYRRLADYVARTFQRDAHGAAMAIPYARYGVADAFFEAHGRYSPIMTCNEWVAGALRAAGAPAPLWSPFPTAVMAHAR